MSNTEYSAVPTNYPPPEQQKYPGQQSSPGQDQNEQGNLFYSTNHKNAIKN